MAEQEPHNLEQLLGALASAEDGSKTVSVGELFDAIGHRSFGPLLLLAGIIGVSPISGVPGVPTLISVSVVVVAAQLFMRRGSFWLPAWLIRREFAQSKLDKAIRFMTPVAKVVDKVLRPRLCFLTSGPFVLVIAGICVLVALSMPPLELVPFAASTASAAIAAFGLALIARDGLIALLGIAIFAASAAGFALWSLG